ncbi:hypothetical protein DV735_g4582, partial [Chaetothyriales sp. CBS 134920]
MSKSLSVANTLRKALYKGNGPSFGAWQMLPGSHLSRTIARYNEMHESVHAIAACGVSPIVRIAANEGWMVKRALDAGAHGIIVPLLYTVEDARKLVEASKFPPQGRRGFGSPFSMGTFDVKGNLSGYEYMTNANENLVTVVQIETKEAFEDVEAIAKVDGIDVLFIGPWDLGNNLGYPVTGEFAPELKAAVARILKAAHDAGKKAGIYCASGDSARQSAEQGFQMISVMNDMTALPTFMTTSLAQAQGSSNPSTSQEVKGAAYGGVVAQQTR